jgi:hypothetical protein
MKRRFVNIEVLRFIAYFYHYSKLSGLISLTLVISSIILNKITYLFNVLELTSFIRRVGLDKGGLRLEETIRPRRRAIKRSLKNLLPCFTQRKRG